MATYPGTPIENLNAFNTKNYQLNPQGLRQPETDLLYLQYPVAQGPETLQDTIVNGLLTTNQLIVNSTTFGNGGNTSSIQIGTNLTNATNNSVCIGPGAGSNQISSHNISIGSYSNSGGCSNYNTIIGSYSSTHSTGTSNTIVGADAGNTLYTGNNNTMIGKGAIVYDGLNYATAIGSNAVCGSSNSIAFGRDTGVDEVLIYGNVRLSTNSLTYTDSQLGYTTTSILNTGALITSGVYNVLNITIPHPGVYMLSGSMMLSVNTTLTSSFRGCGFSDLNTQFRNPQSAYSSTSMNCSTNTITLPITNNPIQYYKNSSTTWVATTAGTIYFLGLVDFSAGSTKLILQTTLTRIG